jgi:hypothetical protein
VTFSGLVDYETRSFAVTLPCEFLPRRHPAPPFVRPPWFGHRLRPVSRIGAALKFEEREAQEREADGFGDEFAWERDIEATSTA